MRVWRVGHRSAPCDFTPAHLYEWSHRFDDSLRRYRTLYCADHKGTCLREVLADLRPDKTALADFEAMFGPDPSVTEKAGVVTRKWRAVNVLAQARMDLHSGQLVDVESVVVRGKLEKHLADFLKSEKIPHLDIKELRSRKRRVTQRISSVLFDWGDAGVRFRSHLDDRSCYALFEGRASLARTGEALSLSDDLPELKQICAEFSLRLAP